MVTRLSQVTDEDRATLDPDQWRLLILAELGNHADLASAPWSRLRELEFVPGFRLDAPSIILPEDWLPTSNLRRRGARTLHPSSTATMADVAPSVIERREECVRRCMLALWLPALSGRDRHPLNPTSYVAAVKRLFALVRLATEMKPDANGSVFSHLYVSDIEAILREFSEANKSRANHGYTRIPAAIVVADARPTFPGRSPGIIPRRIVAFSYIDGARRKLGLPKPGHATRE